MAISRREAIRAGISYGTGVMRNGNDSIVYDRRLRRFPQDTTFQEFKDSLAQDDLEVTKERAAAFRHLMSELAFSHVYAAMAPVMEALEQESLPAPADIESVEDALAPIVRFLAENA